MDLPLRDWLSLAYRLDWTRPPVTEPLEVHPIGFQYHITENQQQLEAFDSDFVEFFARFAHLFARREPRQKAIQYVRSLMAPVKRRNGWQLAEAMGDKRPDATQRLLNHARWSAPKARDLLMDFAKERFGDPEAVVGLATECFVKKGGRSVGVSHQYHSATGKIENCQVGVFLVYASPRGRCLLDRSLYLPASWCEDTQRRERAHIPSNIRYSSKSRIASRMLRRACRRGVPMSWVTGEEVFGDDPTLRARISANGLRYVLAVSPINMVWTRDASPTRMTVAHLASRLGTEPWQRVATRLGKDEAALHEWARVRVLSGRRRPGDELWLLVRRSVDRPSELSYYLSNAGADVPLEELARIASTRFTIAQCLQEAKGDLGLDQYEVRSWPSWHRHVTLTMTALSWLASLSPTIL